MIKEFKILFSYKDKSKKQGARTKLTLVKSWLDDMKINNNIDENRRIILIYDSKEKMIILKSKKMFCKELGCNNEFKTSTNIQDTLVSFIPNSSKTSISPKITIRKSWLDDMGIVDNKDEELKKVILMYSESEKMIILKSKKMFYKDI